MGVNPLLLNGKATKEDIETRTPNMANRMDPADAAESPME